MFLTAGRGVQVWAATETGNIEICLEDTGEKINREGIVFQYSKVASLVDGNYEMETKYKEKADLNEIQYAREMEETARKLSSYHFSDGICKTDKDGKAVLGNLKEGVYLIYASDENESKVQPVLVQLPEWEEEDGIMNWEVRVCPKQLEEEETEVAKTGDSSQTAVWAAVCFCAGVLILLIVAKKE